MPVLDNPRHERFAHEIAKGTSQREAYRIAGYRVSNDASADASARLLSDARVAPRVQEIQNAVSARAVEKTGITKTWVIAKLVGNVERAMEAEPVLDPKGIPTGEYKYNGGVANRALELLGKEIGMFVDRKEVGGPGAFADLNDEELQEAIIERTRELAELDPEFAEFAQKLPQQKRSTKH